MHTVMRYNVSPAVLLRPSIVKVKPKCLSYSVSWLRESSWVVGCRDY